MILGNLNYLTFLLLILASACLVLQLWLKTSWLPKGGLALTAVSFVVLLVSLVVRSVEAGRLPFSNGYEYSLSFAWIILLFSLILMLKVKTYGPAAFTLPIATILVGISFTLSPEIAPLMPALQSNWLVAHVATSIVSYGAFALTFGVAINYLVKIPAPEKRSEEQAKHGEQLEKLMYNSVVFGFVFLTLLIITGAVWAEVAWGAWWSWDPKETWALITWLIYAAYLHLRRKPAWRGKKGCYLAIIGFLCVIFTFLGVSFLLPGMHSYIKI